MKVFRTLGYISLVVAMVGAMAMDSEKILVPAIITAVSVISASIYFYLGGNRA